MLAAWADISTPTKILDIGTGGGVIAFILASRSEDVIITAIDIDETSINEAIANQKLNPELGKRITFENVSLQQLDPTAAQYDHIICNPPFFEAGTLPMDHRKAQAKHMVGLSVKELLEHSRDLMTSKGKLHLVLPFDQWNAGTKKYAESTGFHLEHSCEISGKPEKLPNRIMLQLSTQKSAIKKKDKIAIRNQNGDYSTEYIALTKDLYLNF